MRLIPTIEARWATERTQQNLKCRDAGYNGKLAEFLSKFFPQKFDSARDYAKASSVYNLLVTQKLWPSLERPGPCSDPQAAGRKPNRIAGLTGGVIAIDHHRSPSFQGQVDLQVFDLI